MRGKNGMLAFVAVGLTVSMAAYAQAALPELRVETLSNVWGAPYNVQVERTADGVRVAGDVRKSPVNPSRRLNGRVWVEVLDARGAVVAVHQARPWRASPAKHTGRGSFVVAIDSLPEASLGLRVSYR